VELTVGRFFNATKNTMTQKQMDLETLSRDLGGMPWEEVAH
jgi:hypothetical protein